MTTASRRPIRTLALLVTLIGLAPVFDRVASAQFTTSCDVGYVNIVGICVYRGHSDEPDTGLQPVDVATGGQTYVIPMATQPAGAPLLGIADLHTHQFADLGFGGVIFHGASYDPRGIDAALSWCDYTGDWTTVYSATGVEAPYIPFLGSEVHGPEGLTQYLSAPISAGTVEGDHAVSGTGDFSGWPNWSTTTHQQMYYKWLERAYQGGLRLMVVHALSNQALCQANKRRSDFTCDDMDAVDKQIDAAKALEITIDTMNGGPGKGWYHIAYSPQMARDIIQNGGLAVILGIEVDHLFGCGVSSTCTDDSVRASLQHYFDLGVRHLFPVHVFDNGFGGAALYTNLFNDGNYLINGYFFNAYDCSNEGINFKLQVDALGAILSDGIGALAPELTYQQMGANCNARGLTPLGQTLIEGMINLGMIVDTDHMSKLTRDAVLQIAEAHGYPVVSGHSGYPSQGAVDEFGLSDTDIARIRRLGGMVTIPITRGDADPDWCQTSADYPAKFRTVVGKMGGTSPYNDPDHPGIAFSTDINGFVPQAAPRFGPKACPGKPAGGPPLLYGIGGQLGGVFGQQWTGNRQFDFNTDGYAQIGMLPDFFRDLNNVGMSDDELAPMLHSAETYIRMWERISNGQFSPDTNPPAITNPGPVTVNAEDTWGAFVNWQIAATDPWTGSLPIACAPTNDGGVFPIGVTAERCTATGSNGVIGSASFNVTVSDSPMLVRLPNALTAEASAATGARVDFAPLGHDLATGFLPVTCVPASGTTFALGTTIVACSTTDHGDTTSGTFTVTVGDHTPPTISLNGLPLNNQQSVYVTPTAPGLVPYTFSVSAVDAVDGAVPVTCNENGQSTSSFPTTIGFAVGVTTVSCTSHDAHGNAVSASFNVIVGTNTAPPVIAGAPGPSHTQGQPGFWTFDEVSLDEGPTVHLSSTNDGCVAYESAYSTAHPNWPGPACLVITATSTFDGSLPVTCSTMGLTPNTAITLGPTATALRYPDITSTYAQREVNFSFPPNVSCAATDLEGNSTTVTFTALFEDHRPPVLQNVPGDMYISLHGEAMWTTPTAIQGGVNYPVTCSPQSPVYVDDLVSPPPDLIGTPAAQDIVVTCTSATPPGEFMAGTAQFTIHVNQDYAPAPYVDFWSGPSDPSAMSSAVFAFAAESNTVQPAAVAIYCVIDFAWPATICQSPIAFTSLGEGVHYLDVFTEDSNGDIGDDNLWSWTIQFPPNVTPSLTVPANVVLEATGPAGAIAAFSTTATDAIDGTDPVACVPVSGSTFPLGSTIVTCSSTDQAGGTATGQFTVTVNDTTAPVMPPFADITVAAVDATGAPVTLPSLPAATDLVDGTDAVTCVVTGVPGSWFPIGATTVTCSSTDQHGNTASASFVVHVQDTTAPVVAAPADQTVVATGPAGAAVTFTVLATDNVDVHVPVVCSPASGTTFPVGATQVTCEAIDRAGNVSQPATFTVHVTDVAPVVTAPANLTLTATGSSGAVATFTASATDIVDGTDAVACAPASGSTFPVGTTTVTCSATDAHGRSASATFTVTVNDTSAPIVSAPGNLSLEATGPAGAVATFNASATDLVDGIAPVVCAPASGSTFVIGLTTVTCSATDKEHLSASASFVVTVRDTTPPVMSGVPANVSVAAISAAGAIVPYAAPTALDLVDGSVTVVCAPASGATFPVGTTAVSCTATDAHGNTASASFSVTVTPLASKDKKAPVLTMPGHQIVEATGPDGAVVSFVASALDAVDGSVPVVCAPASGSMFLLGKTTVSCSAADRAGNTKTGSFDVTVRDTTAPTIVSVTPTPALLPDLDQMVAVAIAVVATDVVDPAPACAITKVAGGPTAVDSDGIIDWTISGTLTLNIDAVARKHKDRTYTITVKCTDFSGNASKEKTAIVVSHPKS